MRCEVRQRRSGQHLLFSLISTCQSRSTFLQGDIEKSRTVCDEFLSKYPLCYGYWQQYATAEAQHGDRAKVVYEQAVASTPYSPDIWGYYIEWLRKQEGVTAEEVRTCVTVGIGLPRVLCCLISPVLPYLCLQVFSVLIQCEAS